MKKVKTIVFLPKPLCDKVVLRAEELKIPLSQLFTLALQEHIHRHQNRHLLEQINAACDNEPDPAEQRLLQLRRHRHRQLVEGEW